jgi:hypothetical protein
MKLRKADIILIAIVVLIAAAIEIVYLVPKNQPTVAVIIQDGKEIKQVDLKKSDDYTFEAETDGLFVFEAKNGKLRIVQAPCRDQICVRTGWISQPGQAAICLPYRLQAEIRGAEPGYDIIIR